MDLLQQPAAPEGKVCTTCRRYKDMSQFKGKRKDGIVKQCQDCRDTDARNKSKPEIREKRLAQHREKKYYQAHREKKRNENEEEYLRSNANRMKTWRDENKEHLDHWKNTNINYNLHAIRGQAKYKGIPWAEDFTKERAQALMAAPCFYCNLLNSERVNGIDRMDNNRGYELPNVVSCCKYCNFVKKALDAHTFVERCLHIHAVQTGQEDSPHIKWDIWKNTKGCSFGDYLYRAVKKGLPFHMSKEAFETLRSQPCHYCHRPYTSQHKNGVDRVNNEQGYVEGNCVSCCGECNQMKGDMSIEDFVNTCRRVSEHYPNIQLPEMPRNLSCVQRRAVQQGEVDSPSLEDNDGGVEVGQVGCEA